jgi:hypothetical protein
MVMSSKIKVQEYVEALIYSANFKKINIYVSSTFRDESNFIHEYDWDFRSSHYWDFDSKKIKFNGEQDRNQDSRYRDLEAKNRQGSDLYWMVNSSVYLTREPLTADITHCRAVYVDLDYQIEEVELLEKISFAGLPFPSVYFKTVKGWQEGNRTMSLSI